MTADVACEFCGNDDAAYAVCLDCLRVPIDTIAEALASELGGTPADFITVAEQINERLG